MNVIYPDENLNYAPADTQKNVPDFDMRTEKETIDLITKELKSVLIENWKKQYSRVQVYPNKFSSVSQEMVNFLLSFQNTLFYNDLAKKFGLSETQRNVLPQIVWNICLNKSWSALENLVQAELKISPSVASQVASIMNQGLLLKAKEVSEKSPGPAGVSANKAEQVSMLKIPIQEALRNYPELGEQLISFEKITLKNFPQPVRPSIKNWLADYTFTLGHGKRGTVERGRYLFQNPNTGKLKSEERQRLSYILNAFDENVPVTINKNTKQVVFPLSVARTQTAETNIAPPAQAPAAAPSIEKRVEPGTGVHFSYSQKMPYEGNKLQPQRIVPLERNGYSPAKQDDRALGKNVVNLKEL